MQWPGCQPAAEDGGNGFSKRPVDKHRNLGANRPFNQGKGRPRPRRPRPGPLASGGLWRPPPGRNGPGLGPYSEDTPLLKGGEAPRPFSILKIQTRKSPEVPRMVKKLGEEATEKIGGTKGTYPPSRIAPFSPLSWHSL